MELALNRPKLIERVQFLSWFTVAYNIVEGIVSIGFGVSEGSVSLAGFGVDSLIEVASALVVLWRFRSESSSAHIDLAKERRATFIIGYLFLFLSVITIAAALLQVISGTHPETTLPGVVIATISLSFMFYLYKAKIKLAHQLDSKTIQKDADCSMACIKLSFVLFAGSLIFVLFPTLWWADAAAALILAYFVGLEGWQTISAAKKPDFAGGCCKH